MSDPCNLLVQIKDSLMRGSDSNLVTAIFEGEEPTSSHRSWGQSWCQSHSLCPRESKYLIRNSREIHLSVGLTVLLLGRSTMTKTPYKRKYSLRGKGVSP